MVDLKLEVVVIPVLERGFLRCIFGAPAVLARDGPRR